MATHDELKEVREQKKALLEKQRELQAKADEGKEERKAARKQQAESRKEVRKLKSTVRDLNASVYGVFSTGTSEEVKELADELEKTSAQLVAAVRSFAEGAETLEEL